MRQGLVVQAGPSPLANAFTELTRAMHSGPSAEERAYRDALARKTQIEADQAALQQQAQGELVKALPKLLEPQQIQGPDINAVGPFDPAHPAPTITRAETPEERINRALPQVAGYGAQMGNVDDMGKLMAMFLSQGSADQARQGAMIAGRMPDAKFAPTGAEADRIMQRDNNLDIAKRAAQPQSESEWKAAQLAKNFDTLDKLNPMQQEALGVLPKAGTQISYDEQGRPVITMGGAAQGAKAAAAAEARSNIDMLSGRAAELLGGLKNSGAMPSATTPFEGRAMNALQTSPLPANQIVQRVLDPNAQAMRDELAGIKAQQMTLYRQAANVPATVGDSALESTTLAGALVDPSISYEANMARLKNFQQIYGALKGKQPSAAAPGVVPAAPSVGAAADPRAAQAIDAARAAIASGKSREHVIQRLRQNGIEPPPDL